MAIGGGGVAPLEARLALPLWWPPTKVAGRYLPPYLFERGDEEEGLGGPPLGFIDVDIPLAAITLPG